MTRLTKQPNGATARSAGIVLRDYLYGRAEELRKQGKAGIRTDEWPASRLALMAGQVAEDAIRTLEGLLTNDLVFDIGDVPRLDRRVRTDGGKGGAGQLGNVVHDEPPPRAA